MTNMGRDFHAPRKLDKAGWRVVEKMVELGVLYDSCGCSGPGWRPNTMAELSTYWPPPWGGYRRRPRVGH